jgi:Flp pilus assembly protein TadG
MKTYRRRKTARRDSESGQALVFMVLALSLFLLGAGALCVDMSNLWFHRQAAQNAADAACTAGAMDLPVTKAS